MIDEATDKAQQRFNALWNYRPTTPIATSPLFSLPFSARAVFNWFAVRWLRISENIVITILASICWWVWHPSLEQTTSLQLGWIAQIFIRNFLLILFVAGGLHYLLYVRKAQAEKFKFDKQELPRQSKKHAFGQQTLENMFWTLGSGVFFWSLYEVVLFWGMANGYAPVLSLTDNIVWFVLLFLLMPLWISFHFYWIHRFLHWPPLYRFAHALHHRNTNIGPWSGLSMHPLEHLLFFSSALIHLIIASHPIHILFHLQHQALTAATSHAGYDGLAVKERNAFSLGNFHHQLHHRFFECNYGTLEVPWDKLFGSYHDGSGASHIDFLQRRRSKA